MSRWFRWHEGTCEDGKFRVVARNAGVTVATVMGVWAVLLEDASHDDHRGIAVRGEDFYGAILDLGSELQPILEMMENIGLIACCTNDTIEISNWNKRQYETDTVDGTNADRQRRFREKRKSNDPKTDRNGARNGSVTAMKRPETDTDTDTETEQISEANASGADAPPDPAIPEREYFARGREVLGNGSGGLIGKLLKAKGGNVALARAAIEQASQKQNPTEYVAAICRGPPMSAKPLTEFQRKQAETNDITAQLRSYASGGRSGGNADRLLSADHGERPEGLRGGSGQVVLAISRTPDRGSS